MKLDEAPGAYAVYDRKEALKIVMWSRERRWTLAVTVALPTGRCRARSHTSCRPTL